MFGTGHYGETLACANVDPSIRGRFAGWAAGSSVDGWPWPLREDESFIDDPWVAVPGLGRTGLPVGYVSRIYTPSVQAEI